MITMADGSLRPVEDIRSGDSVMSGYGSGTFRGARVVDVRSRVADSVVIHQDGSGTNPHQHTGAHALCRAITSAPPRRSTSPISCARRALGIESGPRKCTPNGQVKPIVGYRQRSQQERADALWVVSTHASENEARAEESDPLAPVPDPNHPVSFRDAGGAAMDSSTTRPTSTASSLPSFDLERWRGGSWSDRNLSIDHPALPATISELQSPASRHHALRRPPALPRRCTASRWGATTT